MKQKGMVGMEEMKEDLKRKGWGEWHIEQIIEKRIRRRERRGIQ